MIKIQTSKLQNVIAKAVMGAGNNKIKPITTYMLARVNGDAFEAVTTDDTNYLVVSDTIEEDGEFKAVVDVETFSKLVAKLDSEYTTLDVNNGVLTVTSGRGHYSIGLPTDDDGDVINYPIPYEREGFNIGEKVGTLEVENTTIIMNNLKPSLAVTAEKPWYTGFYMGTDMITATDTVKMSVYKAQLFSKEFLLNVKTANLLPTDEAVDFYLNGTILTCKSAHSTIYSSCLGGIEFYAVEGIKAWLNGEYGSSVNVSKRDLSQIIERITLFIGEYDGGLITFNFGDDLTISNKASNGVDVVEYIDSRDVEEITINLNVRNIQPIIRANRGDDVNLSYNKDKPKVIKITDGDVISLVSAIVL